MPTVSICKLLTFNFSFGLFLSDFQIGEVVGSAGTEGAARQTQKQMYNGKVPLSTAKQRYYWLRSAFYSRVPRVKNLKKFKNSPNSIL